MPRKVSQSASPCTLDQAWAEQIYRACWNTEFLPLKLITKEEPQETSALVASFFFPLWSGKVRYSNSNHS